MTGLELVVGYLAAWAWRKVRRVVGRADAEVDQALDAGMDRLHELVAGKLGSDPALTRLETEARSDLDAVSVRARTSERVRLALEDAVESDPAFATRLEELVARVREADQRSGGGVWVAVAGEGAIGVGRDISGIASTGDDAANFQHR